MNIIAFIQSFTYKLPERCWWCCGSGERVCSTHEHPKGYKKCTFCQGTGYGESIETYWKRNGIKPKRSRQAQEMAERRMAMNIIRWTEAEVVVF